MLLEAVSAYCTCCTVPHNIFCLFWQVFPFLAGVSSSNGRCFQVAMTGISDWHLGFAVSKMNIQVAMAGVSNWHLSFAVGGLNAGAYPHVC